MKLPDNFLRRTGTLLLVAMCAVTPLLAAEESAPDPTEGPAGLIFRWLNFALVAGAIIFLVRNLMAPAFRASAKAISEKIHGAAEERAAAEKELREAERKVAGIAGEIQDMRNSAAAEAAAEAERLKALAKSETEKIAQAAQAEIRAAERAGNQELRVIAARLATQRAAAMVREQMNPAAEAALFDSFVNDLERSAQQ